MGFKKENLMDYGRLEGLIPLIAGAYIFLLFRGVIPVKNKETFESWKKKFGLFVNIAAPIAVIYGLLRLLSVL